MIMVGKRSDEDLCEENRVNDSLLLSIDPV